MRLTILISVVFILISCGGGSSSSVNSKDLACRVFFDGKLAYCAETDTATVTDRGCKDRMYQVFDGINILVTLAGKPEDKATESSYEVSSSCSGDDEIVCPGHFMNDTTAEHVYQSRYAGYCSSLEE